MSVYLSDLFEIVDNCTCSISAFGNVLIVLLHNLNRITSTHRSNVKKHFLGTKVYNVEKCIINN